MLLTKGKRCDIIPRVENIGVSPSGKASDSDSDITGVRIPAPQPKNTENFVLGIFLSKPQAWYIIDARSAAYIIKGGSPPLYLITRQRASYLRLDDIQCFALMIYRNKLRMIYTPSA